MRILMLGWEFPPFIAGGLGVACYGLTKALDRLGHEVVFILPKPVDRSHSSHVTLLSPHALAARLAAAGSGAHSQSDLLDEAGQPLMGFQHAVFRGVQASFTSPYPGFDPANFVKLTGLQQADLAEMTGSTAGSPGAASPADQAAALGLPPRVVRGRGRLRDGPGGRLGAVCPARRGPDAPGKV